jgi:hypothetical protein
MSRVIGILLIVVLVGGVVWFILSRRKKQKTDCEKLAGAAATGYEAYSGDKIADTGSQKESIVSAACGALETVAKVGGKVAVGGSTIVSKGVSYLTGGGCEGCPPVTSVIKILGMSCTDLRKYCKAAPAGGLPSSAFCKVANDRKCPA